MLSSGSTTSKLTPPKMAFLIMVVQLHLTTKRLGHHRQLPEVCCCLMYQLVLMLVQLPRACTSYVCFCITNLGAFAGPVLVLTVALLVLMLSPSML